MTARMHNKTRWDIIKKNMTATQVPAFPTTNRRPGPMKKANMVATTNTRPRHTHAARRPIAQNTPKQKKK